jgi:hypothetical protein
MKWLICGWLRQSEVVVVVNSTYLSLCLVPSYYLTYLTDCTTHKVLNGLLLS